MLPMVATAAEARDFAEMVDGRATVVLLVERVEAVENLADLVSVPGVDEVHIGLNDLALSLNLKSRWQVLAGDLALEAGRIVRAAGMRFGLGGIGRPGDTGLPVPADLVYAEIARTGARGALVSRSFWRNGQCDLSSEVARARAALDSWSRRPPAELEDAHAELGRCAARAACW